MEYSSNSKGNLGVTLGAIGTGLGVLNDAGILTGNFNRGNGNCVSRDEIRMIQELATKDSQIAMLSSENDSERKMIEVYKQAHSEIANLTASTNHELKELREKVYNNEKEQAVVNAKFSDAISVNTSNIADIRATLGEITQIKIPNSAVCPGWGPVNVMPSSCSWPIGTTIA